MSYRRHLYAWAISLVVHGMMFSLMAMIVTHIENIVPPGMIESVMLEEDDKQELFTQELDTQVHAAETLNPIAGGAVTEALGGSNSSSITQQKMNHEEIVKDPEIEVNIAEIDIAGMEQLGNDLGSQEVSGEVGAVVEGYGDALDRLTLELIRLMRQQRITVVWLFDESESMKDDQAELKKRFKRIYDELGIFQEKEGVKLSKGAPILLSSVVSYGEKIHYHMRNGKPTDDLTQILKAIDSIPVDPSGIENTQSALIDVIKTYKSMANSRRKLVVVLISDESGDDGHLVEDALLAAKRASAPVYILGRESVFGSLYAHVNWTHPQSGATHRLPIRRGPETPYFENLQFDGIHRRYDAHLSGFGPYEQVRLARETGGIFFMLPHEEQRINDLDKRKYETYDLREYLPSLDARVEYDRIRGQSKFRVAMWQAAVALNPYDVKDLEISTNDWLSLDPSLYPAMANNLNQRNAKTLKMLTEAENVLNEVRGLRDEERFQRWRANYDLMSAQIPMYRARLIQYMNGLTYFGTHLREQKINPMTTHWGVGLGGPVQPLTPEAARYLNTTQKEFDEMKKRAELGLRKVIELHPNTPWAVRAEWELSRSVGAHFRQVYINPNPPPPPPGSNVPQAPIPKL